MKTQDYEKIQELVRGGALFVCNHSAGKDSQAMYHVLRRFVPTKQLIIVHADLGRVEWSGNIDFIKATTNGEDMLIGKPVNAAKEPKDLLTQVRVKHQSNLAKGKKAPPWFNLGKRCWGTSDFKTGPSEVVVRHYMKKHGFTEVVWCLGIRAEESGSRSKGIDTKHFDATEKATGTGEAITFKIYGEKLTAAGRTGWKWYPIFDWTTAEVFEAIKAAGQEPHPMYAAGMSRLSCSFCAFGNKSDLRIAAKARPELYAEYVAMEKEVGYTMKPGVSLEDFTGIKAS